MTNTKQTMKRHLAVSSLALSLLGCSAQASVQASGSTLASDGSSGSSGSETLQPRESTFDREAREEEMIANREGAPAPSGAGEPGATDQAKRAAGKHRGKKKAHDRRAARGKGDQELAAASEPAADGDRGHGNDVDGVDEDNPGKSKK
jgi:hypothetical protein